MNNLAQFHFLRPIWLLALLPLLILIWLMVKKRLGSHNWEAVCDEQLLPYILIGSSVRKRRVSIALTAIGGLLAILALAGPVWHKLPQPVFARNNALVIALDLSRSMDATDIPPSRLLRARYKVDDILKRRSDGLTALLVFAGDSFTVDPLTDDSATIESQLTALSTDIMPVQGSNTLLALKRAEKLLKHAGARTGDILFICDDIDYKEAAKYAANLHEQGYRISVLGMGTLHGAPIPLEDGSFLKDASGKIVMPGLPEKKMRMFAGAGGGIYHRVTLDDKDINTLLKFFASHGREGEVTSTKLKTNIWQEEGPWLLIALLPLMALLFRRGYLAVLLICLLPIPNTTQAMDWASLWSRPDQQAAKAMAEGDPARAAKLFQDPAWKGSAQYKSGDFKDAIKSLKQAGDLNSLYNMGNALARMGNYRQAISVYDKVLKQDPNNKDAQFNRELLEKQLQKQQHKRKQQSGKNSHGKKQQGQQGQKRNKQQQTGKGNRNPDQERNQAQNHPANRDISKQKSGQKQHDEDRAQDRRQKQQQQDRQLLNNGATRQDQQKMARSDIKSPKENQQALEQWLRRIPDDPAGLLRRKFLYQYKQRDRDIQPSGKTW